MVVLTAALVTAQEPRNVPERPGWILVPSFRSAIVYEDNVLFTPEPSAGSRLVRLTPRLDAFYRRDGRQFEAGYTFDAERYPEPFTTLNDAFARQEGFAELRTLLNRRSSLVVGGNFLSTSRPEEVLQDTGLISLRRRSKSVVANAQFTRTLSRRLSWSAGYGFSLRDFEQPEGIAPRLGGTMHSFVTGVGFRHSPRSSSTWNYGARIYVQDELASTITPFDQFVSHVGTYRFSRALTRKIDVVVSLGPRYSEGLRSSPDGNGLFEKVWDIAPEAFASLEYRGDDVLLAARYTRTQSQAFGLSGFVDTDNGVVTAAWDIGRRLHVEANPGVYRNTRAGLTTNSFQADVLAEYRFLSWASLVSSYTFQHQDRLLAIVDGVLTGTDEGITRNTVLLGIKVSKFYAVN